MRQAISSVFLGYSRLEKKAVANLDLICLGNNFDYDVLMENIFKLSDLKVDPWSLQVLTPVPVQQPFQTQGLFGSNTISEEEYNRART